VHNASVVSSEIDALFVYIGVFKLSEKDQQRIQKDSPTRIMRKGGPMTTEQRNEAMAVFLESLCKDPNISLACDRAGIIRDTAYKWRDKYKEFAKGWEDAIERTRDTARSSIYQRAIIGWEEPVTSMGKVVYDQDGNPLMLHKWSDALANTYAKANLPEFKDKQSIDLNATLNGQINSASTISIDTRALTPDQLTKLKALATDMKGGQ
jgi:hypothetical protein